MDLIAGMQPTGRRVQGPGFELAGLDGDRGVHTAIVLVGAPDAGITLREGARAFLERPGFAGLARLVAVDRAAGAAVFATGEVWSAAEVLASLRRRGRAPGLRAGLELAWQAAELLSRAHKEAGPLGAPCHGAIDPWRLALRRDGQVVLLGYDVVPGRDGLACEGAALAEALRYAPPERVDGRGEDGSSDLFSLALVALEWIVGEPVYAGPVEQIRESAREADGDRVMWAWRDRLPKSVAAVLGRAIRRDADARWPDAASFAAALRQELGAPNLEGESLHALLASKDIDPPIRFVALDEERGDADTRALAPEAGPSPAPDAVRPPRARVVSLGGRLGRAGRAGHAAPPPAPEQTRAEGAPTEVAAIPAAAIPAPEPPPGAPAPPDPDDVDDVDDADPAALAELLDAPEPASDDTPTAPLPRPGAAPTLDDELPTLEAARPSTATEWTPVGPQPVSALTADGVVATAIFDAGARASRVALGLASAAGLSRLDSNGRVVAVWRLWCDGAAVGDLSRAASLADRALTLVRGDARPVTVRVRVGARVVEANVSTALFAVEAAAALAGVGGLSTGRSLVLDGAPVDGDALLDGLVRPGATVEIVP